MLVRMMRHVRPPPPNARATRVMPLTQRDGCQVERNSISWNSITRQENVLWRKTSFCYIDLTTEVIRWGSGVGPTALSLFNSAFPFLSTLPQNDVFIDFFYLCIKLFFFLPLRPSEFHSLCISIFCLFCVLSKAWFILFFIKEYLVWQANTPSSLSSAKLRRPINDKKKVLTEVLWLFKDKKL